MYATSEDVDAIARAIVARVGGLGFLERLLRNDSGIAEVTVNPDGSVWVQKKGGQYFERFEYAPPPTEVWRAVETMLAPLGRSVSEAAPSVDAKLPRTPDLSGGARIKIIHPAVAPGEGFPSINIRLFEARPVPPAQLAAWGVAPLNVIQGMVEMVTKALRVMVIGGTASGKTTMLSAVCHGVPKLARVVKIEDPEEIWLDHPHVVTLEARPAQVGSSIVSYDLDAAVRDAMRMSPRWLIVGEMRDGKAIKALLDAQMSDHPGLSTFHAEGPNAMIKRMCLKMAVDEKIDNRSAKEMITEAIDVVVQVGFVDGKRAMIGAWEVEKTLKAGDVQFRLLYAHGDQEILPVSIERRV
jgi:pilus assembly protein CpaF